MWTLNLRFTLVQDHSPPVQWCPIHSPGRPAPMIPECRSNQPRLQPAASAETAGPSTGSPGWQSCSQTERDHSVSWDYRLSLASWSCWQCHLGKAPRAGWMRGVNMREDTVKWHFYECDKLMQICQNESLDKFIWFLFMCSSVSCIIMYGTIKIAWYNLMRPALDIHN